MVGNGEMTVVIAADENEGRQRNWQCNQGLR